MYCAGDYISWALASSHKNPAQRDGFFISLKNSKPILHNHENDTTRTTEVTISRFRAKQIKKQINGVRVHQHKQASGSRWKSDTRKESASSVFPTDEAVTELFYLALRNISKKWTMQIWDWKAVLNHFTI